MEKSSSNEKPKAKDLFTIREPGWKKLPTTSLFRLTNFELYAKPNKFTMIVGAVAFFGCVGLITYMNLTRDRNAYTTLNDDGTLTQRVRTSRWD